MDGPRIVYCWCPIFCSAFSTIHSSPNHQSAPIKAELRKNILHHLYLEENNKRRQCCFVSSPSWSFRYVQSKLKWLKYPFTPCHFQSKQTQHSTALEYVNIFCFFFLFSYKNSNNKQYCIVRKEKRKKHNKQ